MIDPPTFEITHHERRVFVNGEDWALQPHEALIAVARRNNGIPEHVEPTVSCSPSLLDPERRMLYFAWAITERVNA